MVTKLNGQAFTGVAYEESPDLGRSEVSYREGVQEGPARDWYPSGLLQGESHYVQGVLHGTSREFDESGRIVAEANYEYGICLLARRFNSEGIVIESEELDPNEEAAQQLDRLRVEYRWGVR
ncbi:toxin-antitoxin system YwqK family antitoxin [Tenggerimyces flavus]|uniref:Toxin-antitoxin system YwqK family antitoxin n=1 Tax=Tenggerimyces flavus TaxID=1708749 RepID=A0ABV7YBU6_9ACTN|nr:hypothetical protein [Tenggerimyces flavus]MBM7789144.1 antitoxin component YwqK of YwqJK toxin-antitoxin module [Tenggerimyces flavus]